MRGTCEIEPEPTGPSRGAVEAVCRDVCDVCDVCDWAGGRGEARRGRSRVWRLGATVCRLVAGLVLVFGLVLGLAGNSASGQSTFRITGVSYTGSNGVPSPSVPAGVYGASLQLTGTLPTLAQQAQSPLLGCFYTGYGSTAGIPLALPNSATTEPLSVPASTIQAIPQANFTAANGYAVTAKVYIIRSTQVCDGTFDASLTNQYSMPVVAPSLGAYAGPTNIPQSNPVTAVQAAPLALTLTASGQIPYSPSGGGATTVTFGSFGSVALTLPTPFLYVPVPAQFSSSPVGTTASLSICNTYSGTTGATNSVCTTPAPAITLTVAALATSAGTLTATPTPVLASGQTVLTAQFAGAGQTAGPGAPSGPVNFVADGMKLPSAKLVLDKTATFAAQTTSVTTPAAATPVIAPAGGSYTAAQTVSITDATAGATIYYTQDGSTPTTASTVYTAPFTISSSQTIQAIAAVAGSLNSAVASAVFSITLSPPTKLAFTVQPVNSPINTAFAPPIQVAIEDVNSNVVTSATNAVTLGLGSNPGDTSLGGTLTVNAVNGIATFSDLTLGTVATGYTLSATSGTLASATSSAFNITPYPITLTVQSALIGIGSTLNGSFTLGHAAPTGGVVVTLSSSTPANATIAPATVTVAQGQTTGSFTYTGVAAGNATLSASAPNYLTGTVQVTGTAAQVSLGTIPPVAPGQMVSLALSLPTAAPPGGTTVTFTSSNTNVATVTSSVTVPAGQRVAATNPQITGIIIGTTTITASAPGFAPDTRSVNVTVVATFNPATTNLNLITSTNTTLNISAPAQTGGITFTLTTDDPTIATVASPVTVAKGATSVPVTITGVKNGTTTIRADSAGVTEATGTININSTVAVGNLITGVKQQNSIGIYLPVSPSVPTTVTLTITNPAIATISGSSTTVGTTTVTVQNVTSTYVGTFYIQGQAQGTTTLSVSAPGYTTGTGTMSVYPSGFTYYYGYQSTFSTTSYSSPTTLSVYTVDFDPTTGNYVSIGLALNPGISAVNVPVTSSNTTVGTITTSPLVFHAGDNQASTSFQPASPGTSNLTIGTPPAPFSVPSLYQQEMVTVTTPAIAAVSAFTGVHLQSSQGLYLPAAPPTPVTVTITSNGPRMVVIAANGTTVGGTTVTIPNVSSTYIGSIYLQGVTAGTTTLTISAPGYTSGTDTISVYPSGFSYYYGYSATFSTTTNASPYALNVYTVTLDPSSLSPNGVALALSPGTSPVNVPVTSSNTAVGTISSSPLVFNPGDTSQPTSFQPLTAGTSTLSVGTPAGFSTSSNYTSEVVTVTAPTRAITFGGNVTTGVKLQNSVGIYLSTAPTSPITVTVTSSAPADATVSNTNTTVGTTTTTFTNVTSTYAGTLYVQGQAAGSATLTASAAGYSSGTSTVTVNPSGFTFYYYQGDFTTTTFSSPSGLNVYATVLDPTSLATTASYLGLNPGVGPISVPVTSSAPSIGTITTSPVVIASGSASGSTSFQPVSAGASTIAIGTPAGFSTPSNYTSLVATVTAPVITVSNVETGLNLQNQIYISLPQTPPNPITVTVTSNGPQIAVISKTGTVVGGTTLTFTNVTSTNVGYIYVQGQSLGATTITVSAPGYTNGNGNVTVDPSGFTFYYYQGNFTTTTTSQPTGLTVYGSSLTPGTLTVININLQVSPGFGSVSVPVTSSNPAVATITNSPLVFAPGVSSVAASFKPVATGTSTITIGTPAGFSTPSQYTQITGTVQ